MNTEQIIDQQGLKVSLRLQPDACCVIIEFVEPGFADPWRYKVSVDSEGIHWQEGHRWLPRLGGYERKIVERVRQYNDELPF